MTTPDGLDPRVRELKPSATLAIQERCRHLLAEGKRVYWLGLGQSPFPVPELVVDALRANAAQKDYLPVKGLPALRAAVADYHRRRMGSTATDEDVLVAPGSKELMFLLQLVLGGEVLIPAPAWVSYAPQARVLGKTVHFLETSLEDGFLLSPSVLADVCRSPAKCRLLVLNYPSNPTGNTYSDAELSELAEVARKHGVIVLSDEIYGELHFEGQHASIARHYPEGTIIASGLSKWCGAGGWRLGTFAFAPELRWLLDAVAAAASETYTSTSAPIQHAAVRAFQPNAVIETYLMRVRRVLSSLMHGSAHRLRGAGLKLVEPRGAFYLFVDASAARAELARRDIHDSVALSERLLLETGVATLPGTDFGMSPKHLLLRLALVDFDGARALSAVESGADVHSADFLERYCGACVQGVGEIGRFISGGGQAP